MLCQEYDVYDQLLMGVRMLDIRLCKLVTTTQFTIDRLRVKPQTQFVNGRVEDIYCSHTFLSVPFQIVVHDVWRFLAEYPSETVLMIIRPDHRIFRTDFSVGWLGNKGTHVEKLTNSDMTHYVATEIERWFNLWNLEGVDSVRLRKHKLTPTTTLGELRSHMVLFPDKYSFHEAPPDAKLI
jgi:hypothetical protein